MEKVMRMVVMMQTIMKILVMIDLKMRQTLTKLQFRKFYLLQAVVPQAVLTLDTCERVWLQQASYNPLVLLWCKSYTPYIVLSWVQTCKTKIIISKFKKKI